MLEAKKKERAEAILGLVLQSSLQDIFTRTAVIDHDELNADFDSMSHHDKCNIYKYNLYHTYSFMTATRGKQREVMCDAKTGAVCKMGPELIAVIVKHAFDKLPENYSGPIDFNIFACNGGFVGHMRWKGKGAYELLNETITELTTSIELRSTKVAKGFSGLGLY